MISFVCLFSYPWETIENTSQPFTKHLKVYRHQSWNFVCVSPLYPLMVFVHLHRNPKQKKNSVRSGNLTKQLKMVIYSGFTNLKWWCSIVVIVYQRYHVFGTVKACNPHGFRKLSTCPERGHRPSNLAEASPWYEDLPCFHRSTCWHCYLPSCCFNINLPIRTCDFPVRYVK